MYACLLPFAENALDAYRTARLIVLADAMQANGLAADLIEDLDEGELHRDASVHLRWRTQRDGDDEAWSMVALRPHEHDDGVRWRAEARVAREAGAAWASYRLTLQPTALPMTPVHVQPDPPKAVELLLGGIEVVADGRRLTKEPTVVDADGVPALVELLTDPARRIPIVVVSLERATDRPLVDTAAIAHALAGLAHVFTFDTADTSFALTDALGDKRSVFLGAVRLYWPGFTLTADPWSHPLFLPERITAETSVRGRFERFLLAQLVPVAAMRLPVPAVEARVPQRHAKRRAAAEAARERAAAVLDTEWQEELERAWSEEERMRAQIAALEARLERTESELQEALTRAAAHPEPDDPPSSVAEATERAAKVAQHLVFLPEAFESAWRSPYQQPEKITRALLALDEVAGAYRRGEMGRGIKAESEARGLPFRSGTSPTARVKYGRDYQRNYDGRTIELGPHIAFGTGPPRSCARTYLHIDDDNRVFVIGYVGSHLRDTRTG